MNVTIMIMEEGKKWDCRRNLAMFSLVFVNGYNSCLLVYTFT